MDRRAARPWAHGDAEAVAQPFVCECGDPAIEASVLVTLRELSSGPVLAPGHR